MGILQNYNEGNMNTLRSVSYSETGTQSPYVVEDINNPPNSRGLELQVNKRVDDLSRISQMLIDKPGLKHLANEALLKQGELSKKLEGNNATLVGNIIRRAGGTLKYVAQVAGSTLAQVPVNGTGTHFLRGFRTDTYLQDGEPTSGFAEFFGAGGIEGAQYALRGERVPTQGLLTNSKLPSRNTTASPGDLGKLHIGIEGDIPENTRTSTYRPDSTYNETDTATNIINASTGNPINNPSGTGEFDQTFAIQTTATEKDLGITNKGIQGDITGVPGLPKNKLTSENTFTGKPTSENISNILNQGNEKSSAGVAGGSRENVGKDTVSGTSRSNSEVEGLYDGTVSSFDTQTGIKIQDFRSDDSVNSFNGGILNSYSLNYRDPLINKETRVGLGNPGLRGRNKTSYTIENEVTRDKINYLDVKTSPLDGIVENRDLIQLEFQILTPEQTYYLAFRAFLDSFDDSFTGQWNTNKYLGRADNFYTYNGFERSINIGFKIAAQTREEMKPLYRKAATLASVTAPTYGDNGRFMRGSLAKVTVGDYIYEQPGIIESVNYTWQKDYPWEISFQNPEGNERSQILPHLLDVSLTFKVIHDFIPQTGINPLITNYRPIQGNKDTYIELAGR